MSNEPSAIRVRHIHFDRCNWRVQDKTNKIDKRGFTTQYAAWIWRQTERAARGLPVIDDAPAEWFTRDRDAIDAVREMRREYKTLRDAAIARHSSDVPEMVEYNGLDALINTGYVKSDPPELVISGPPVIRSAPAIGIANHEVSIPKVLTLDDEGYTLVISDLHCPYHSGPALEQALTTAWKRSGGRFDCVIAGDLFDFAELSRHPKDEREEATELVLSTGGYVLRKISEYVPGKVSVLPGNHDHRMSRRTGIPFRIDDLLALAFKPQGFPARLQWTLNDYLIIDHASPARRWLIGHPRNYSSQGGYTAARIAQLRQINVITAHDHTTGQQMSADGKWRGISCGHMTRAAAHSYKRASLSIHREWSAGFVILADGIAECYSVDA